MPSRKIVTVHIDSWQLFLRAMILSRKKNSFFQWKRVAEVIGQQLLCSRKGSHGNIVGNRSHTWEMYKCVSGSLKGRPLKINSLDLLMGWVFSLLGDTLSNSKNFKKSNHSFIHWVKIKGNPKPTCIMTLCASTFEKQSLNSFPVSFSYTFTLVR